jgi:hypothetical protein
MKRVPRCLISCCACKEGFLTEIVKEATKREGVKSTCIRRVVGRGVQQESEREGKRRFMYGGIAASACLLAGPGCLHGWTR